MNVDLESMNVEDVTKDLEYMKRDLEYWDGRSCINSFKNLNA
jgi:hypothetical protein